MYRHGIIVAKMVGKRIPDAYWEKVFAGNNITNLGFALAKNGSVFKTVTMDKDVLTIEALNEVQDAYVDDAIVFHLADFESGFQPSAMQPFPILSDSKGKPLLVAFLNGRYEQFAEAKSTLSPAEWAVNKLIMPEIHKEFKAQGNDVKKVMDSLRSGSMRMVMKMAQAPGGFMTLLANTGEIQLYGDNREPHFLSFGWTTDTAGYSEDQVERKEPVVEVKRKSLLSTPVASVPSVVPTPIPVEQPVEAPPVELPQEDQKDDLTEFETKTVEIPKEIQGKKNKQKLKGWFRFTFGFLPQNYTQITEFTVRRNKATGEVSTDEKLPVAIQRGEILRSFADLANSSAASSVVQDAATRIERDEAPVKDTAATAQPAKPVRAAETAAPAAPQTELTKPIGYLSDQEVLAIKKGFIDNAPVKRSLDRHNQAISNPAEYKVSLLKIKSFADEMKIKMEDTFKWDMEALEYLCANDARGAALLMANYRANTPEFRAYVDQLSKPKAVEKTQIAAPQGGARKRLSMTG